MATNILNRRGQIQALLIFAVLSPFAVLAQQPPAAQQVANIISAVNTEASNPSVQNALSAVPFDGKATTSFKPLTEEELKKPFTDSFLFSPLEIAALQRAHMAKDPVAQPIPLPDLAKPGDDGTGSKGPVIPAKRQIKLSGVLLRKPGDWIVWINGQKMIPSVLLPEIIDIKVERDIVHLKWYDIGLNKILNISLRPHQTYDITSGVLLPG